MRRMLSSAALLLATASLLLSGCAGERVNFKSVADVKYDQSKGRKVTGQSCGFQLLLLIPININRRGEKAYEALLEDATPDAVVTDIKVQEKWFYAFVGTVYCTEMEGTAYPMLVSSK